MLFLSLEFSATDSFMDTSKNCEATYYRGKMYHVIYLIIEKQILLVSNFQSGFFIAIFGVFITCLWYNYR